MKCVASCCGRCRHYTPEGRRGGHCEQLGVPVQGRWEACSLAMPAFLEPLPALDVLERLPQPIELHFREHPTEVLEAETRRFATYLKAV